MTIQELADQSGYHRVSLARLIRTGKVPGVTRKPSGRTKIKDCLELAAWIELARIKNEKRFRYVHDRAKRSSYYRGYRFVTAPEVARITRLSVSRVRRILLDNYSRPEARGKRLFYPVTPTVEKWLSSGHSSVEDRIVYEEIPITGGRLKRSIARVGGRMSQQCATLGVEEFQRGSHAVIKELKEAREMIDDLIEVAGTSAFRDIEKSIVELRARAKARKQKFNGSIPAVPK